MKKELTTKLITLLLLLLSCAKIPLQVTSADNIKVYPPLPEKPRIQYLTSINSSVNIEKKRSPFRQFVLGKKSPVSIIKPYGITSGEGKIYLCDLAIDGLIIIDLEKQKLERFIPSGLGTLQTPVNCFFDDVNKELYVADSKRKQIVVFDAGNKYVTSFGSDSIFRPVDVAVFGDSVYVSNSRGHSVQIYDRSTKAFLGNLSNYKEGNPGYLYMPINLYVSHDKIYVVDFGEFVIKTFSHSGKYLGTIGSYGRNISQFMRPKGMALDKEKNLFVVDGAFENVQVFNDNAELLLFFGGPYRSSGDMWLPANIIIDYDLLKYFQPYVYVGFNLEYLVFVTNQYGPDKLNVYGFVSEK